MYSPVSVALLGAAEEFCEATTTPFKKICCKVLAAPEDVSATFVHVFL